ASFRFGFSADRCVCLASRCGYSDGRCAETLSWCDCIASRCVAIPFAFRSRFESKRFMTQESFFCCLVRLPTAIIIGVPMTVGKNQTITGGQLLITGIFGVFVTSTAVIIPI